MVEVRVPATTANLGPGFDCLGLALNLYNRISLNVAAGAPLKIHCSGPAATTDIALDENNLVYRAAAQIFALTGKDPAGIQLKLHLESPLARGLGSSASAIVGGMVAANEFLKNPLTSDDIAMEATRMEGHPDNVIPCLVGGLTASIQLDDSVLVERIIPAESVRFVVFVPDYELETARARAVMPKQISVKDAVFNSSRIPFVLARLQSGDLSNLQEIMSDRIHQPYRIPLIKGYEELSSAVKPVGAASVCISGAGPTILAIADQSVAQAVADTGQDLLLSIGVKAQALVLSSDLIGCQLV